MVQNNHSKFKMDTVIAHKKPKKKTKKRCSGGQPKCRNFVGDYIDVEGVGCCKQCDDYIDDNPYDPYWEHMEQDFANSKECEELDKEDYEAYEKAFEIYQANYESWPDMRRRMAKTQVS